jgi:hypothetical protein
MDVRNEKLMREKRMDGGQNSAENRKARKVYREWWEGLSEEEKGRAPVPEKEDDVSGMDGNWVFEVDESILTVNKSHWVDEEVKFEGEKEGAAAEPQRMYSEDEVQEVVRRVVMAMQMSENADVLFQARCILIAFGIGDPPTESELARVKGCSRQFVSKKVKRIQALFNLSPSQYMRSDVACRAYSRAYWANKRKEGGEDE